MSLIGARGQGEIKHERRVEMDAFLKIADAIIEGKETLSKTMADEAERLEVEDKIE